MKITTRSSYTVRALLDLAQHSMDGKPVRLSDISEREGISHAYLEQLFNRLKKVDVVQGRKGPGGGYVLGREAADISIGDVIRAVEGAEKLFLCTEEGHKEEVCNRYPGCVTHILWERLSRKVQDFLCAISLADLLAEADSIELKGDKR